MRVFHVTERRAVPAIRKRGLRPSGGDFGEGVYVWLSLSDAWNYAFSHEGAAFELEDPVIVEAEVVSVWRPKIEDILQALDIELDDLDPNDEDYYLAMGVVEKSIPARQIVDVHVPKRS